MSLRCRIAPGGPTSDGSYYIKNLSINVLVFLVFGVPTNQLTNQPINQPTNFLHENWHQSTQLYYALLFTTLWTTFKRLWKVGVIRWGHNLILEPHHSAETYSEGLKEIFPGMMWIDLSPQGMMSVKSHYEKFLKISKATIITRIHADQNFQYLFLLQK